MSQAAEQAADGGRAGVTPARLLAEMRAIGDRTRAAARGYWLPLLLFGLLICGSLPFYQRLPSPRSLPGGRPGWARGRATAAWFRVTRAISPWPASMSP